jgi:hypothetical protein
VYEGPQTRERVHGRTSYVRFNTEGFPGDWHLVPHQATFARFTSSRSVLS